MTTPSDFKNINEFFDELNLLRKQAGRAGQLAEDLKASRNREQQLEMRVAALSKGATMIPGISTDPWLDKVGALKELCDQKDATIKKLQEVLSGYDDENERLLAAKKNLEERADSYSSLISNERSLAYSRTHAALRRSGDLLYVKHELKALDRFFYERLNSLP